MNDPIKLFGTWFEEARARYGEMESSAMTLATATKSSVPSARIVLLKACDERGFVFYTNMESRKSEELKQNPNVALCFYWAKLERQVRIEGTVEQVEDKEADEYFATRPFLSRISAIVSKQSHPLPSREVFLSEVETLQKKYADGAPPRPDFWSGWRVVPRVIEFWQEGKFRLHDREVYTRNEKGWSVERLYP